MDQRPVADRLFDAARAGDATALAALLDAHPGELYARAEPYAWTLLHAAAHAGHLAAVDELLGRGLDPNAREAGDETTPMHWAAAAGHVAVVRRLVEAGGDVVGHGDLHELEIIGWATCWDGADDDAHRAIVDLLLAHGARHHVFSAIATRDEAALRAVVAADRSQLERPMSRFENRQRPLHFAARTNRPAMVALLLELGADPDGGDAHGVPASVYAMQSSGSAEVLRSLRAHGSASTLLSHVVLREWRDAEGMLRDDPGAVVREGVLHLVAKRGDAEATRWLLAHGADPNARWAHWGADVTPLHLCAFDGHLEVARLLLDAGADATIRDSMHDGDALGWAEHFERPALAALLRERAQ
jgi:ankyrin repeat protein